LAAHVDRVTSVAFSPNGRQIASAAKDCYICLWDPEDQELIHVFGGHYESVFKVTYSPQGTVIASSSDDCTIRLWDTTTGECTHILICHTNRAFTLEFSPDGKHIAFSCSDGSMRVWDIEKEACIRILTGHSQEIHKMAYSPQGDMIISGGEDKTARLWDVASGQCLAVIQELDCHVRAVQWVKTSDANYVVTGYDEGTMIVWKLVVDGGQYRPRLYWKSIKGDLDANGTILQDAQGLSRSNKELLRQRKAIGEPGNRFRDAAKKLTSLASVISKLKAASSATGESLVASANDSVGQVEQANEAQVQEIQGVSAALIQALRDRREEIRVILGFD
jgi:WD40 repeat protein